MMLATLTARSQFGGLWHSRSRPSIWRCTRRRRTVIAVLATRMFALLADFCKLAAPMHACELGALILVLSSPRAFALVCVYVGMRPLFVKLLQQLSCGHCTEVHVFREGSSFKQLFQYNQWKSSDEADAARSE